MFDAPPRPLPYETFVKSCVRHYKTHAPYQKCRAGDLIEPSDCGVPKVGNPNLRFDFSEVDFSTSKALSVTLYGERKKQETCYASDPEAELEGRGNSQPIEKP